MLSIKYNVEKELYVFFSNQEAYAVKKMKIYGVVYDSIDVKLKTYIEIRVDDIFKQDDQELTSRPGEIKLKVGREVHNILNDQGYIELREDYQRISLVKRSFMKNYDHKNIFGPYKKFRKALKQANFLEQNKEIILALI